MSPFEQQVAEALLALPIPRRTHSVEVVKNILAPHVAAALLLANSWKTHHTRSWQEGVLEALRGGGDGAP